MNLNNNNNNNFNSLFHLGHQAIANYGPTQSHAKYEHKST